jgi:hypothetical protein
LNTFHFFVLSASHHSCGKMLSRSDLKYNFGFLRLACALNLLPMEFGGMDGGAEMKVQKSRLKRFFFSLWQFYVLFCSLYISSRSARAVAFGMNGRPVKLHPSVTCVIFSVAFGASSYGTAILFRTHLDLTIKLFNELTAHFGKTEGFGQGRLNEFCTLVLSIWLRNQLRIVGKN